MNLLSAHGARGGSFYAPRAYTSYAKGVAADQRAPSALLVAHCTLHLAQYGTSCQDPRLRTHNFIFYAGGTVVVAVFPFRIILIMLPTNASTPTTSIPTENLYAFVVLSDFLFWYTIPAKAMKKIEYIITIPLHIA